MVKNIYCWGKFHRNAGTAGLLLFCCFVGASASRTGDDMVPWFDFRVENSHRSLQSSNEDDPLVANWEKEEDIADFINDKLDAALSDNPTESPSAKPTRKPTRRPTSQPTSSPTNLPTLSPTESTQPSGIPSMHPSSSPSSHPTLQPSISAMPSSFPSAVPSLSTEPSAYPSMPPTYLPSTQPSSNPSISPSFSSYPTGTPTVSSNPTFTPTLSTQPTAEPTSSMDPSASLTENPTHRPTLSSPPTTATNAEAASTVIINRSARNSTPLYIVGACCFIVMASTSVYLYKRTSKQEIRNRRIPIIGALSHEDFEGDDIPPCDGNDFGRPGGGLSGIPQYREGNVDEEHENYDGGRDIEMGADGVVPECVAVIKSPQSENKNPPENHTISFNGNKENDVPYVPRFPGMKHVPKMFHKQKSLDNRNKANLTWAQMRAEGSPCSSGYAPASLPSPMFSPLFVKGLSTMISPYSGVGRKMLASPNVYHSPKDPRYVLNADAVDYNEPTAHSDNVNLHEKSIPMETQGIDSPIPMTNCDDEERDEQQHKTRIVERDERNSTGTITSPISNCSKSSKGSTVEWNNDQGDDVLQDAPPTRSFEDNMAELKNLLISINSMGSGDESIGSSCKEASSGATNKAADNDEVESYHKNGTLMSYTPESGTDKRLGSRKSTESDLSSHGSALGNISETMCEEPLLGVSCRMKGNSSLFSFSPPVTTPPPTKSNKPMKDEDSVDSEPSAFSSGKAAHTDAESGFTFERELLSSTRNEGESINFQRIFNDQKNEFYECRAPSGPLGIVIDNTPLGPRVNSLNPLSPLFGAMVPGDIIVGIDELDTVGMDAGEFMQIVAQRSHHPARVLTVLKI